MGAGCCKEQLPVVHIPLPNTLPQWDKFSRENTLQCVAFLNEVRIADMHNSVDRLCGPYAVEVLSKTGKASQIVVRDIPKEVYTVYNMLKEQVKRSRSKNAPMEDVRRESALCMMNLPLLQEAGLVFMDELDPEFVSAQLEAPLEQQHVVTLCNIFEEVNTSHTGAITLAELGRWVSQNSPSITQSVFFILFTEIVATDTLHQLRCVEFVAAVDRYCILSQDQLLQHVFYGLADTTTADGEMAIDILGLMDRFPILTAGGAGDGGKMPLLKMLAKVYNQRLANPSENTAEARLVTQEDYMKIHQQHTRAFDQLFQLQQIVRRATLGHRVWNQRRRIVEKALQDQGKTRAGLLSKSFTLREVRDVSTYYSVRALDEGAEELRGGMGDSKGDEGPYDRGSPPGSSHSHRSSGSYRGGPRGGGGGPGGGPTRAKTYYGGMGDGGGAGGGAYKSPAQLSPRATADFETTLKNTYSWAAIGTAKRGAASFRDDGGRYKDRDGGDGRPPWSARDAPRDYDDDLPESYPKMNLSRSARLEEEALSRSGRLLEPEDYPPRHHSYSPDRGPPPPGMFDSRDDPRYDSRDRGYDDRDRGYDDRRGGYDRDDRGGAGGYGRGPPPMRFSPDRHDDVPSPEGSPGPFSGPDGYARDDRY